MIPEKLLTDLRDGRVILVSGTGLSIGGRNRYGKEIANSEILAKELCKISGFTYNQEPLRQVYQAAESIASNSEIIKVFRDNFCECTASESLKKLLKFTWKRFYTFNVDDTIRSIPIHQRVQRYNFFNGLYSRREEWSSFNELSVVHLHGIADQIENGIIFSETEYAEAGAFNKPWYERLGEDFSEYTILFVGTSLDEPVFRQLVTKFKPSSGHTGNSFMVSPSTLSPIVKASLKTQGIVHIQLTAEEFANELIKLYPNGLYPKDMYKLKAANTENLGASELEALRRFIRCGFQDLSKRYKTYTEKKYRQLFYEGFGPNWPIIIREEFSKLDCYDNILQETLTELEKKNCVAIIGEAGCGKTTLLYWLLTQASEKYSENVYIYNSGSNTLTRDIIALRKFEPEKEVLIFVEDSTFYNNEIQDILSDSRFRNIKLLLESRKSDWREKNSRKLDSYAKTIEMPRYSDKDIPSLIRTIDNYYAAPSFSKIKFEEKVARFKQSKKQLLIALREATKGSGFSEIIDDEVLSIEDADTKHLLLIASLATIAGSGIKKSTAQIVFNNRHHTLDFETALENLSGIVEENPNNGRLYARHELYGKDVISRHTNRSEYRDIIISIIEYFSKFEMPIVKSISISDSKLFRYILNNRTLYNQFESYGNANAAIEIYEKFDTKMQQDGHYWMQYGLLLRRLRRQREALDKLNKSIEAYPDNPYAVHALAQQKIIYCTFKKYLTAYDRRLIDEAVSSLVQMHESSFAQNRLFFDDYPLITVSYLHINLLVRHRLINEALENARKYYDLTKPIQHITKFSDLASDLLKFVTNRQWNRFELKKGSLNLEKTSKILRLK
jgi:GTPase SAR1 family protein